MSIKHVKNYYRQICTQYKELLYNLRLFEQEANNGLVEPDRVDEVKKSIDIIKVNYERWTYMMHLLYMPNKKDKAKKYILNSPINRLVSKENMPDSIIEENKKALEVFSKK